MEEYKVLITTSGIGSRLGSFTDYSNKCLTRLGNAATITKIIELYSSKVEFVITLGHFGDHVKQYLKIAHPEIKFQFVDVISFVFVIVIGGLYAFSVKGEDTYIQKFGDGAVRAGWLGSLIGVVSIFGSPVFAGSTSNLEALGAALAIATLTVLYGYFFKLGSIILD